MFFKMMESKNFPTWSKLKKEVSKQYDFEEDEGPVKATSWASGNDSVQNVEFGSLISRRA